MNCFDCHELEDTAADAVAVCRICGAGVCPRHARARAHDLHRVNGMGIATRPVAARRVLCGTCIAAEQS